MSSRLARAAVAGALFFGLCAYTAPNKQFHNNKNTTRTTNTNDKKMATDANSFILFKFTAASRDATGERTINRHKVTDLIANTDAFAQSLVEGFLADRYPKGYFTIGTRV